MRRRRVLLSLGVAVVVTGAVLCWPRGPRDPVYDGKRLSQWLAETNRWNKAGTLSQEAIEAIKALGTNAVPYLLSEFERGGPKWLENLKQGSFVRRTLGIRFKPKWVRRNKAISALFCLGPDAAPALPTLARYFDDPERGVTAIALAHTTGAAGLSYLLKALSSRNPKTVDVAINYLRASEENGKLEMSVILKLMNHDNEKARAFATSVLKYHPPMVSSNMAVLRRALSDPAPAVRRSAVCALREFPGEAWSAVPDLLRLLDDPDPSCASLASNLVAKIDPSALLRSRP